MGFIALWILVLQRGGGFELNLRVYPKKSKPNAMRLLKDMQVDEDEDSKNTDE